MDTVRPRRGLYFTADDVATARANVERFSWARGALSDMRRRCDEFLAYSDERLYDCILGMRNEVFAYGIAGCPHCGKPFPMTPGEQRALMSPIDDLPVKKVTCPSCGITLPNERFPDSGHGFEANGKGYYPVGMWNFFIAGEWFGGVRDHEGLVTKLTYLYMLTGDRRYARRALLLLDGFSAIFPGTLGPRDFTPFGSTFEIGRLHLLTSIVHRVKVCLAHDYDWLHALPELDEPSPALGRLGESGTMRENIRRMLNDYMLSEPGGPAYDLRGGNLTNLQNHETDGIRAMLAVGLALGRDDYCEWGRRAVEACFYNAIGRDGMYYEGSFGYSLFTSTVFLDIALLAARASNREQLEAFHPFACERFFRFAVDNPLRMLCQGHLPSYGDWGRDRAVGKEINPQVAEAAYRAALYFYRFSPDVGLRGRAGDVLAKLYPLVRDRLGSRGIDLFFGHPHDADIMPEPQPGEAVSFVRGNTVMGQAGICILRDARETTVLTRFGPSRTHGHDDPLAVHFYALGREITADIGYGIYGTNAHYGWGSKAVAHHTVVVNEDDMLRRGQLYKPFSGGEIGFMHESGEVSAVECLAPSLYGLNAYQRMLAVVPTAGGASYVMDFFHIDGARRTDYSLHAFHEESRLAVEGVVPASSRHWTLSGVTAKDRLPWDAPGQSFGERLTTGETFSRLLPGEEERLWTPEPNNGYGYIYDVKEYAPEEDVAGRYVPGEKAKADRAVPQAGGIVRARWETADGGCSLDWLGLAEEGDRLLTGLCPSLENDRRHSLLIHRSERPWKTYAAVFFARSGLAEQAPVLAAERLSVSLTAGDAAETGHRHVAAPEAACPRHATAVRLTLPGGYSDCWLYGPAEGEYAVETPWGRWEISGRCGWLRLDAAGRIVSAQCLAARQMRYRGQVVRGRAANWRPVVKADAAQGIVWVAADKPAELPKLVRIRPAGGGRSAYYPVRAVEKDGELLKIALEDTFVLSKGVVRETAGDTVMTEYPLPLGVNETARAGDSPMAGKRMCGSRGGRARILDIPGLKTIRARIESPFAPGEAFDIVDVQEGDELDWG